MNSDIFTPREELESNNSEDEDKKVLSESRAVAWEMDYGELQTYLHRLLINIREFLGHKGSSLLDRCSFPAFMDYCHDTRAENLELILGSSSTPQAHSAD